MPGESGAHQMDGHIAGGTDEEQDEDRQVDSQQAATDEPGEAGGKRIANPQRVDEQGEGGDEDRHRFHLLLKAQPHDPEEELVRDQQEDGGGARGPRDAKLTQQDVGGRDDERVEERIERVEQPVHLPAAEEAEGAVERANAVGKLRGGPGQVPGGRIVDDGQWLVRIEAMVAEVLPGRGIELDVVGGPAGEGKESSREYVGQQSLIEKQRGRQDGADLQPLAAQCFPERRALFPGRQSGEDAERRQQHNQREPGWQGRRQQLDPDRRDGQPDDRDDEQLEVSINETPGRHAKPDERDDHQHGKSEAARLKHHGEGLHGSVPG